METKDKVRVFVGMDIGGTLAKLCVWFQSPVKVGFENIEDLKIPFKKGEIFFRKCNNKDLDGLFKVLQTIKNDYDIQDIYVTGGGSYKYQKELLEIDEKYNKLDEMSSLMKGINFLNTHVSDFAFNYSAKVGKFPREHISYPYILCNIGSGVSIVKFTGKGEHARIGGTSIGGGTFLGLCNIALGIKNFDTAIELANKGSTTRINTLIKDVYRSVESPNPNHIEQDAIAVSLGRLTMANLKNEAQIPKEDIVKSFLFMVAFNIAQISYYYAKLHKVQDVFFAGNFIRNNDTTMESINYAMETFSNIEGETRQAIFLKHDGFIGALGCLLMSSDQKNFNLIE